MLDEINNKIQAQSLNITASLQGSGTNNAIRLTHNEVGTGSISIDTNSNAYETLFCRIENQEPTYIDGKTIVTPPQEGSTTPEYEYKPAYVTSAKNFTDLSIDDSNDNLQFNVSGVDVDLDLTHGNFNSISDFKDSLQNDIDNSGIDNVTVEIYNSSIRLKTKEEGDGQSFSNLEGSAADDIFNRESLIEPTTSSVGTTTYSTITGRTSIGNDFEINDENNSLEFNYIEDGTTSSVSIQLNNGTYATRADLIDEINNKLDEVPITASSYGSTIRLKTDNGGSDYRMDSFSGGFYENVLNRVTITDLHPYENDGYTNPSSEQETYIVGRTDISGGLEINPHINDNLTFDLSRNGSIIEEVSINITAEHYTPNELVSEINSQLDDQGINYVRAEYGSVDTGTTADDSNKLVLRYDISDKDNGEYVIDGIRGNSAYTLFYNSSSEPTPTYTVGVLDLSQGVEIIKGKNDTFSFDINGENHSITFEAGEYPPEELLSTMNNKLEDADLDLVASYYEGKLKLSFNQLGGNTIDNIGGNASGTLFFSRSGRDGLSHKIQTGANSGQFMELDIFNVGEDLFRVNTTRVHTKEDATKALQRLDYAIDFISDQFGRVGGYQNCLEHTFNNQLNSKENLQAAESRIKDADMAKEKITLTKQEIISQASMAILAQANSSSNVVLKLLDTI